MKDFRVTHKLLDETGNVVEDYMLDDGWYHPSTSGRYALAASFMERVHGALLVPVACCPVQEKPWSVCLWGSHPDEGLDDCSVGDDFATEAEARAVARDVWAHFDHGYFASGTRFVEIDGPTANEVLAVPGAPKRRHADDDREWQREIAMEAGMLHGAEAYNDAMGWS